jgi:hypothetical protein
MIGIMSADEMEDYLELQDPKVTAQIRKSTGEYLAGRSRPAEEFLAELKNGKKSKTANRRASK